MTKSSGILCNMIVILIVDSFSELLEGIKEIIFILIRLSENHCPFRMRLYAKQEYVVCLPVIIQKNSRIRVKLCYSTAFFSIFSRSNGEVSRFSDLSAIPYSLVGKSCFCLRG